MLTAATKLPLLPEAKLIHLKSHGRQMAPRFFVSGRLRSNAEVYVINSDGTNQRNISNNPGDDYLGSWQPLLISTSNPVDDPQFFVRQHYEDFFSREPDPSGFEFWTNEITSCGSDAKCIDTKRQNVSAAYRSADK